MKKDSRRLFTFGCSYTTYISGPTWADLLGLEFEHFENWGIPGVGCRAIAERVAECHAQNRFTKDDIVIVQWSTHLRHDYHNPMSPRVQPDTDKLNWRTGGSVFSPINRDIYTDKWLANFFYEPSYIMHGLNHILLTQQLLKNSGCTWYMTSIGDWCKLSSDLDNITGKDDKHQNRPEISIQENIPEYIPWTKMIWDEEADHWLMPLAIHAQTMYDDYQFFTDYKRPGKMFRELHPSPKHYATWLNQYLRPKLGLGDPPEEQSLWVDTVEALRKKYYANQSKFWEVLGDRERDKLELGWWPEDPDYWPTWIKGY